jgi:hypothetical protein
VVRTAMRGNVYLQAGKRKGRVSVVSAPIDTVTCNKREDSRALRVSGTSQNSQRHS